jgi:hypothetical protein
MWSYARRLELWEQNNRTTREAGGQDCVWAGMNSGSVTAQARSFRDLKEICRRADIMMLDHQRRDDDTGFQQNGDTGKRVHGLLGWDKVAPESMAMYQSGPGYYRVASKPAAEARMWMIAGMAGGIQPWWHHVGAYHDDRRMYRTAEPVMRWWRVHERYLVNRIPVARSASCGRSGIRISSAATSQPTGWTHPTQVSCTRSSGRESPICRCTPTTSSRTPRASAC